MSRTAFSLGRRYGYLCFGLLVLSGCAGGGDEPPAESKAQADAYTLDWNTAMPLAVADNDNSSGGERQLSIVEAPAHGSAKVQDGQIVYLPDAGFFGEDALRYRLLVKGPSSDNTAQSEAAVKLTVQAQLTLKGQVSDAPIPNALVTASLGADTITANADAQGMYSLSLKSSRPGDFLSLTGSGVGGQSTVVLSSLVGELGGLAKLSQGGVLNTEQAPGLQISHYSSALAELIRQGGPAPSSNQDLATAAAQLNPVDVLNAAALVKLVVDEGVALPAAAANTQALLQSPAVLSAFAAEQASKNSAKLQALVTGMATDPSLQVTPDLPSDGPLEIKLSMMLGGAGSEPQLRLMPDKTAVVTDYQGVSDASWVLDGKTLVLNYLKPRVSTSYYNDSVNQTQGEMDTITTGLKLRQIGANLGGQQQSFYSLLGYWYYKTGSRAGEKVDFSDEGGNSLQQITPQTSFELSSSDFAVGSRWGGLYSAFLGDIDASRADVLRITGPDTALFERTGETVAWRMDGSTLELTLADGLYRFSRLVQGTLGDERWLMEVSRQGQVVGGKELSVLKDQGLSFDASSMARKWQSQLNAAFNIDLFYVVLRADGMSTTLIQQLGQPESTPYWNRLWGLLPDGKLLNAVGRRLSNGAACLPTPQDSDCQRAGSAMRTWQLLGRKGANIFVLETLDYSGSDPIHRVVVYTDRGVGG